MRSVHQAPSDEAEQAPAGAEQRGLDQHLAAPGGRGWRRARSAPPARAGERRRGPGSGWRGWRSRSAAPPPRLPAGRAATMRMPRSTTESRNDSVRMPQPRFVSGCCSARRARRRGRARPGPARSVAPGRRRPNAGDEALRARAALRVGGRPVGHPQLVALREADARRHHADDGDGRGRSGPGSGPRCRDRRRSGAPRSRWLSRTTGLEAEVLAVLLAEVAAQHRLQPEQREEVGRDRAAAHALRLAARHAA